MTTRVESELADRVVAVPQDRFRSWSDHCAAVPEQKTQLSDTTIWQTRRSLHKSPDFTLIQLPHAKRSRKRRAVAAAAEMENAQ